MQVPAPWSLRLASNKRADANDEQSSKVLEKLVAESFIVALFKYYDLVKVFEFSFSLREAYRYRNVPTYPAIHKR